MNPEQIKERYEFLLQEIARISKIKVNKRNELSLDQSLQLIVSDQVIYNMIFCTAFTAGLQYSAMILDGTAKLPEKVENK